MAQWKQQDYAETARWEREQAYQAYRQGERADPQPQKKSWWEKALDWVDNHQPETSIGVGAIVGAIAIGVTLMVVGTVTLPVLAIAAGAAAVAAGAAVVAGTVGLNVYYDRPPTTNIWNNVKAAAITAAAVTGVGLFVAGGLLTQAAVVTGNAIAGTCAANPAVCAHAGVILDAADKLEEAALAVQLTVETVTGNPHAGETAIELQLEQMDGGAPGNTAAAELGEQLAKLGDDVPELIATYGDEIVPLLLKYGEDAVDIIGAYGDEGITLLRKFGSDTPQAINLIKDFGAPAVRLLDTLDVKSAGKLLQNLEPDVLDYAIKQGPDAVSALSKWKPEELEEFGVELALRAEKDAKVIADVKKLVSFGPIDPAHLTKEQKDLIDSIAKNCTQYPDGKQVMLGSWAGLGDGYAAAASETGSVSYVAHPDLWPMLGKNGAEQQEQIAWLVNQQVMQPRIEQGLSFEYTLKGVKPGEINREMDAIKAIWAGATDADIAKILDPNRKNLPSRMKELKELYEAGYQFSFDVVTNSYILIKP